MFLSLPLLALADVAANLTSLAIIVVFGLLATRGFVVENAVPRICRESGARAGRVGTTNTQLPSCPLGWSWHGGTVGPLFWCVLLAGRVLVNSLLGLRGGGGADGDIPQPFDVDWRHVS